MGKSTKKSKTLLLILLALILTLIVGILIGNFIGNSEPVDGISANASEGQIISGLDGNQTDALTQENSEASASEDMIVHTDYGDLYYPEQWESYLITSNTYNGDSLEVIFSAQINGTDYPMFQVTIGVSEDVLVGELTDESGTKRDVHMEVFELVFGDDLSDEEKNRVSAMQEDLNYLIDHLK